jgi:hypothetical protein
MTHLILFNLMALKCLAYCKNYEALCYVISVDPLFHLSKVLILLTRYGLSVNALCKLILSLEAPDFKQENLYLCTGGDRML